MIQITVKNCWECPFRSRASIGFVKCGLEGAQDTDVVGPDYINSERPPKHCKLLTESVVVSSPR